MNNYINFNGTVFPNNKTLVGADNRGLRYGDGLFETIRVNNNRIMLADLHFQRLFDGARLLQFALPVHFTPETLAVQVLVLCKKNGHENAARVRLMLFRGNGGLYDLENMSPNYIIQSWQLQGSGLSLNVNGLVIGVFPDGRKSCDHFSNLKSNNYLLYAMAALFAKKTRQNDCLVYNSYERICESTVANVFCIKSGSIKTPPLTEGCVAGVMRRHLLKILPAAGYTVHETTLSLDDILQADEVFLSNAIHGIRWVRQFGDVFYENTATSIIHSHLVESFL